MDIKVGVASKFCQNPLLTNSESATAWSGYHGIQWKLIIAVTIWDYSMLAAEYNACIYEFS